MTTPWLSKLGQGVVTLVSGLDNRKMVKEKKR